MSKLDPVRGKPAWLGSVANDMTPDELVRERRAELQRDLGPDLGREIEALGDALDAGAPPAWPSFAAAVHAYLDALPPDQNPDPYFNWLGAMAIPRPGTPMKFTGLWEPALYIVLDWEAARGKHTHKGSGYYFAGLRGVSMGNLDRAFLYMHQAAMEDVWPEVDQIPESPAGWFITMDASRADQTAHQFVERYEQFLEARLDAYRNTGRGSLDIPALRTRLTANGDLFSSITSIAHVIAQLLNADSVRLGPILENRFAPSLHATLALELCLIYEDLLQRRHTNQGALGALIASPPLVGAVNLRTDPEQRELNRRSATPNDYDNLIDEVLDAGQPSGFVRVLTDRELDSVVALTTRNRAGHGGERPAATDKRFDEIVPRLFFAVFAVLEDLYA